MPLWSCRRHCCGGAGTGDDDCERSVEGVDELAQRRNNRRVGHPANEARDDALVTLVSKADDTSGNINRESSVSVTDETPSAEPSMSNNNQSGHQHYQLLTLIGEGNYGGILVSLARHLPSNRIVAIKRVDLDVCQLPLSLVQHEIQMHRLLRHKNIVPALDCFVNRSEVWMVMPAMTYGSCLDILRARFRHGLPELAIAFILRDVLQALNYLHSRAIIHRDINARHILIHPDGNVRLSGLRHCLSMMSHGQRLKQVHDFPDFYVHSLNWASRELLEQNLSGYDTKSDMYSIGITACELANGLVPFEDMVLTEMLLSKIAGRTPQLIDVTTVPELQMVPDSSNNSMVDGGETIMPDRVFSHHFHHLVETCLLQEPSARPTAAALTNHSFFKQIHRKLNPAPWTNLLRPLNPITASSIPVSSDTAVQSLTNALGEVTLDVDWTF